MAMSGGVGRGPAADINMTPMIDVLLVLLIIFLVIQPTVLQGILVKVPALRAAEAEAPEPLILEVGPGPAYKLAGLDVAPAELPARIRAAVRERGEGATLFVQGAESLTYGDVIRAIDEARRAGAERVGLVPRSAVTRAGPTAPRPAPPSDP